VKRIIAIVCVAAFMLAAATPAGLTQWTPFAGHGDGDIHAGHGDGDVHAGHGDGELHAGHGEGEVGVRSRA
jgi:hypothetical protein